MSKAVTLLKYTGAVIIFMITYLICSAIVRLGVQIVNFDAQGFWIVFFPYFAALPAGMLSIYGGLYENERLLPTVRPRIVAWVFIGLMGIPWGFALLGLLVVFVGLLDYPIKYHVLMSPDNQSQAVQALVAMITVWKLTSTEGEFGTR